MIEMIIIIIFLNYYIFTKLLITNFTNLLITKLLYF